MAKVGRITDQSETEVSYAFDCPGCGIGHSFRVKGPPDKPCWDFNGDVDNPTFSPSLLVRWPKLGDDGRSSEVRCHSFVRNGRIEFLSDCDHELAGKAVDLPDPTDWAD